MIPSFIKTKNDLTIVFNDGKSATVYSSDPRWSPMIEAIQKQDWEQARELAFPAKRLEAEIAQHEQTFGRVSIEDGVVTFEDKPLHMTLTDRMLEMLAEGFDIAPMARFLDNLMDNPSYRAVNELYDFLEASKLPITEDGYFLAYKRVRGDYKDLYSGRFDNSVGAVCEMPRNAVDEDKNRTCSAGLHFCGREYLSCYGTQSGARTMIVKINPADVVAIPADHNNMKGRTAKYVVVDELVHGEEDELERAYWEGNDYTPSDDGVIDFSDVDPLDEVGVEDIFDDSMDNEEYLETYPDAVVALEREDGFGGDEIDRFAERYQSPAAAERATGAPSSNIRKVLRGERNTAGGFEWLSLQEYMDVVDSIMDDGSDDTNETEEALRALTGQETTEKSPKDDRPSWLTRLLGH